MGRLSAIVVDDERKSLELLSSLLSSIETIEVIGTFTNPHEARLAVIETVPDILFLDIEMNQMSGLELFDELKIAGLEIPTVFVTGYDSYALKALKKAAFDYLSKQNDTKSAGRKAAI